MISEIKTFEERKETLVKSGKEKGYVTYEQLADELKGLDIHTEELDELYNVFMVNNIEVKSEEEVSSGNNDTNEGIELETPEQILEDFETSKDIKINDPV